MATKKVAPTARRTGAKATPAAAGPDLLRTAGGVRRWNALSDAARRAAGPWRNADLAGASLAEANLGELDLRGARLGGANLSKAWLLECNLSGAALVGATLESAWCVGAKLHKADCSDARMARCNLRDCDCRGAKFRGADLRGATFTGADLRGTDFTGAALADATFHGARYDERTLWPDGFRRPPGLQWLGAGTSALDIDAFVRQLQDHADTGRLARALEMLRGTRFRLYADIGPASVVGVVSAEGGTEPVHACRLSADGSFACCAHDLQPCQGLRGAVCKHILLLLVGLARAGNLEVVAAAQWVQATHRHHPALDKDAMNELLQRHRRAEGRKLDWPPTVTTPGEFPSL